MKLKNKYQAEKWFKLADEDLKYALASFKDFQAYYGQICFIVQQAVEKYLKGFLVLHKNSFPKIHDLVKLLKLCSEIEADFLDYVDEVNYLSQFYLITRYPLTEYPPAGKKEAKKAITFAEEVINFVKKKNYVHF
ncbi:hypothetical protein COU23_01765 [Candidatus Kuenenbacteria bacterium CG10_big_fil_rev_8_21_14_0_10_36_11]|uniref:HEPN domain-containing protein n=1 Tax=Candidatus Kuenenbacteria bacterium CG10_big_fil_rev_8_21_14_0_10_36_11 TaxID=1974618 RepID=A0A2M6WAJ3_9BACT|nr:MAG: hypothetical protein COU23_01765 [Candidatus Kuenenbacteria bacterium CG10_big_fil_rev_8_21_14_0_10_36_11]